jgi:phosphate transport system substrate-binding protein
MPARGAAGPHEQIRHSKRKGLALRFKRLASLTCAAVCAGGISGLTSAAASAATLNGAGSTLVTPIMAEWGSAWGSSTGNNVNYQSVGSGKGESSIASGLVDFGASDAPLSVYSNVPGNLVQIPWALTATGIGYRIDGLRLRKGKNFHLTGTVLAEIYLGQITMWNDRQIKRLNPGASIPATPITPFRRSDGSGDTYAFTRYLSDVSSSFASQIGASTTVNWPQVDKGAQGNSGLVQSVSQTNGGVAYIAVAYLINKLNAAGIRNAAGNYVAPNLTAIEAAAAVVHGVPPDNQLTIVNPPRRAKSAYVISTFTYVIVPRGGPQSALLKSFIGYALTGGQRFGPGLDFAPLPAPVVAADEKAIAKIGS